MKDENSEVVYTIPLEIALVCTIATDREHGGDQVNHLAYADNIGRVYSMKLARPRLLFMDFVFMSAEE